MKHDFIDKYSNLNSFIHRLDPRIKIFATLSFILFVLFAPPASILKFSLYLLLIFGLVILSKVPLLFVLKRSLVIVPFVLFIAIFIPFFKEGEIAGSYNIFSLHLTVTYSGLEIFQNVLIKSWLSVLSIILLSSTTRFPELLKGMERMKMPGVIIMILSFFYRYLFILMDEAMRMKRARDSRNFGRHILKQTRTVAHLIGVLFVRSYERGERVYAALLSRGFKGKIRTLREPKIVSMDLLFLFLFLGYLLTVEVWL